MSKRFFVAVALLAAALSANAQETQFKWYGFIRNYAVADSRESVYGTVPSSERNLISGLFFGIAL